MGRRSAYTFDHTWISYCPANWMKKCFEIGGRDTWKVGSVLWIVYSWGWELPETKRREVMVNDNLIRWFGISPKTRGRCLKRLADAGLISIVEYGVGKSPVIRLNYLKVRKKR